MEWMKNHGKTTVRCTTCHEEIEPDKQSRAEHRQYHKRKSAFCTERGIREKWSVLYLEVASSRGVPLSGDPAMPPDVYAVAVVGTLAYRYLMRVDARLHDLDFPIADIETFDAFVAAKIAEYPALQQVKEMLHDLVAVHYLMGKRRQRPKRSNNLIVYGDIQDANGKWQPVGPPRIVKLSRWEAAEWRRLSR
jgi:hypothetical protein